jgi:C-terminal processing protease CtpA/Prc
VRRILKDAPPAGLMVDVRNNPGGDVAAGEKLVQLLTGRSIEPQRYRVRASSLVEQLVARDLALKPWLKHFAAATAIDERLTASEPLSLRSDLNRLGQAYYGPVVLIVDALSYSTTDMFAAAFQDHEVGCVLGVSATTGGGGGTLADYGTLVDGLPSSPLRRLRSGASFSIALMRAERLGERAGAPIEDLGVIADETHVLTKDDLLERNRDLIAAAGGLLERANPPPDIGGRVDSERRVIISARGVDQIDVFSATRRLRSFEYDDEPVPFFMHGYRLEPGDRLRLVGYKDHRRVVSRWIVL